MRLFNSLADRMLARLAPASVPRCYNQPCGTSCWRRCCPVSGGGVRCEPSCFCT
ncbi:hypothetical protein [Stackebrandtia albiflava]|uniref:hypothetical protein n=1 Tax=Stackebrandtia albiflava TaxID=406432 RepID=UPI001315258D|nr:hypothetical protein [Stackebrandtia albiflava]